MTVNKLNKYAIIILACLTLGLAPFQPEPHIAGKLRWIVGGAKGMSVVDWWDALFHGAPWLVLLFVAGQDALKKLRRITPSS